MSKSGLFIPLGVVAAVAISAFMVVDTPDSGLDVGAIVPAFNPVHVTGPDKGTTKCPP